nr:GntR family transcriptional regulator [Kibdelosporangium sp. MJ126-NF4]CEL18120.1 Propionate catabolism operon transcriptional regulator of GntR family [predicted] [Kibdelosporangium sp. MJ126-NF4]CTQ90651.1 Propionate catabolism operon transcriptional regulator of GntR family [predicted] [Kibdelosporangium sp. MJ126-NF4]
MNLGRPSFGKGAEVGDLAPIATSDRVTDAVYESLRNAIFSGALPPGAKLSVPALAQRLAVSRSPVREAVLRLTRDRLAVEEPRRGVIVSRIEQDDLAELYAAREALEGVATRLAVVRARPGLVADLERVVRQHEQAVALDNVSEHTELDMTFHATIREASGNRHVLRMLEEIQAQVRLAMVTTTVSAGPDKAVADHRRILDAIKTGDADLAETRAREHIARLADALRRPPAEP